MMAERTERNAVITDRVLAGETLTEIARDYSVSRQRIRQIALKRGVRSVRAFDMDMKHIKPKHMKRILEFYDRSMPFAHIAEIIGCHPSTVARIARRYRGYNPSPGNIPWTKDEEAVVRATYKKPGWSASKIAMKLNRTRDEVIGKAWRMRKEDAERIDQRAA